MKSSWTVASDLWTLAGVESREKCWAEIIGSFCSAFFLYLPHPTHPPPHFIIIIITVQLRWWKAHNITFSRWVGLLSKDHSGVHKKNNSAQYERKEREKFIIMKTYIFSRERQKRIFRLFFFSPYDLARPQRHSGHHFNVCMVRLALWENMKYIYAFFSSSHKDLKERKMPTDNRHDIHA